ncbi:MAG: dual specificity protein phosphatase [Candidatus Margulisiibacteriota bacterium]|jgi:hypothetical protein
MSKKILSLRNIFFLDSAVGNENNLQQFIHNLIKITPQIYNNQNSEYARNKNLHVQYCLKALLSLETEDFHFLYNGLKNKDITYENYQQVLAPILKVYKSLTSNEKRLLAITTLFHDVYYRAYNTYEAEHGPLGVEYLATHPELFAQFKLNEAENKTMFNLIKDHGYAVDLGRYVFPDELNITAENKKLALLLDFLDMSGKETNGQHVCALNQKSLHNLIDVFENLVSYQQKPNEFYKFRLKHLFCPTAFQEISDTEHKNILTQLHNQPDASKIIDFLNYRFKVDDFNIFLRGYELLPTKPDGQKDYFLYFMIFRNLLNLAKKIPGKYARLDTKDIKNGLTDITHTDVKNFFQKNLRYLSDDKLFKVDTAKNKIYIKYKNEIFKLSADTIPIYDKPLSQEDKIQQKIIQTGNQINHENRTIKLFPDFTKPLVDSDNYFDAEVKDLKKDPMIHAQEVIPNLFIGDFAAFKSITNNNPYNIDLAIKVNRAKVGNIPIKVMNIGQNIEDNNSVASWQSLSNQFNEVFKEIDAALAASKRVLVSCGMGISRSATTVIAYLMYRYKVTFNEAFGFLYQRRPVINPMPNFVAGLQAYEKRLFPDQSPQKKVAYNKDFPILYQYCA